MKKIFLLFAAVLLTVNVSWSQDINARIIEKALYGDTITISGGPLVLTAEPYIPAQFFNGTYTVEQIPYSPVDSTFMMGSQPIYNGVIDDEFSLWDTFPFPFFFFGELQTGYTVGDNGIVSFNNAAADQRCEYNFSAPLPWPDGTSGAPQSQGQLSNMRKAIYGAFSDLYLNPGLANPGAINVGVEGIPPLRKLVCNWKDIQVYPAIGTPSAACTYQIVCYELTNTIEVHVKRRGLSSGGCSWCNNSIIGIQNATGQPQMPGLPGSTTMFVQPNSPAYFAPEDYNIATTSFDSISFRFTPQGRPLWEFGWYRITDSGNDTLSTDVLSNEYYVYNYDDTVHPTLSSAYITPQVSAHYVYYMRFCDALDSFYTFSDTVFINIDTNNAGIDDVSLSPVKIHVDGSDIVVQVADGRSVQLFDAVGRRLAVKPSTPHDAMIRFATPASGTYLVQVEGYPARRVVVVR